MRAGLVPLLGLLPVGVAVGLVHYTYSSKSTTCGEWFVPPVMRLAIVNKHCVPPVREYAEAVIDSYASIVSSALLPGSRPLYTTDQHESCVEAWMASLEARLHAACGVSTSPDLMRQALRDTGLESVIPLHHVLGSLLRTPQPYAQVLAQAGQCAASNVPLATITCAALADPTLAPRFTAAADLDDELCYTLNLALLVQRVTEAVVADGPIHAAVKFGLDRQMETLMETIEAMPLDSTAKRTFDKQKVASANIPFRGMPVHASQMWLAVASNIVSAANLDLQLGGTSNVALGVHLATATLVQVPTADDDDRMEWPLGKGIRPTRSARAHTTPHAPRPTRTRAPLADGFGPNVTPLNRLRGRVHRMECERREPVRGVAPPRRQAPHPRRGLRQL